MESGKFGSSLAIKKVSATPVDLKIYLSFSLGQGSVVGGKANGKSVRAKPAECAYFGSPFFRPFPPLRSLVPCCPKHENLSPVYFLFNSMGDHGFRFAIILKAKVCFRSVEQRSL